MGLVRPQASFWFGLIVVAGLAALIVTACRTPDSRRAPPPLAGEVHGTLFVKVAAKDPKAIGDPVDTNIVLPDIKVYLHHSSSGVDSAPVTTNLFGRYTFPRQAPGTYELRWDAQLGWAAGHHPDPIVVATGTELAEPARVVPEKTGGVLFGRVTFADGGSPWFYDELFSENRTATITVQNAARTLTIQGPVHANAMGYYAVAGLPRGAAATVRTQAEASNQTRVVAASEIAFGGVGAMTLLELPNHRPQIVTVAVTDGSTPLKTAPAGTTVQVGAVTRDTDGDALTFTWKALPGQGALSSASGPTVKWTLPASAGVHSVNLEVKDGRGGYARHQVDFESNKTATAFSGRIVDRTSGAPVVGAAISVNGVATTTSSNGGFLVNTPLTRRYVFNATKPGYALFSRVVDAGETGQTWRLTPAQKQVVDPSKPITLVDERPELQRRKGKGVKVRVPANALVDSKGNKPAGTLTAYLATYDIADGEAPGDWGALKGGKETNLISYGAGFVEFVDGAGATYNLASGMKAEVEVSPPATMSAPAAIALWSYDEGDGYWKESGNASRVAASGNFVGSVSHFSAFNTDLALDDAACLKVLLYPPLPTGVKLRMTNPGGGAFTQTFDFVLDRPLRGIYRVPANTIVHLQLFDPDGTEYTNLQIEEEIGVALPGNNVDSGPPIPAGQTLWPDEPYETCKLVVLRLVADPDPSIFLTYKGGVGTDPVTIAQFELQSQHYYDAVDPNLSRRTLGGWWTANGFTLGADGWPTNAVRTSYLNDNDLGSGRDMYFRDLGGGNIAAFVTNYGLFNQDENNANLAEARATPGATVCMEYSPVEAHGSTPASTPIVKFFVYNGADGKAGALIQTSANLDTFGNKFVPNLCLNCHGGDYSSPADPPTFADIDMRARFRELDTATYKFPASRLVPDAGEKQRFKQQNLMIANAGSGATAAGIRELIAGWYAGGTDDQDNTWTPTGWTGTPQQGLYHDLVKRSCRTCHVAFADNSGASGKNWTTYNQLKGRHGFLEDFVLCDNRFMPHAVITYRNFWLSSSPHQPGVLRDYSDGSAWIAFGECR